MRDVGGKGRKIFGQTTGRLAPLSRRDENDSSQAINCLDPSLQKIRPVGYGMRNNLVALVHGEKRLAPHNRILLLGDLGNKTRTVPYGTGPVLGTSRQ